MVKLVFPMLTFLRNAKNYAVDAKGTINMFGVHKPRKLCKPFMLKQRVELTGKDPKSIFTLSSHYVEADNLGGSRTL